MSLNCIRTLGNLFKILFIRIMNLEITYYTVKAETLQPKGTKCCAIFSNCYQVFQFQKIYTALLIKTMLVKN